MLTALPALQCLGGIAWSATFGLLAFWCGDIVRQYASMASWAGLLAAAGAICGMIWMSRAADRVARKFVD